MSEHEQPVPADDAAEDETAPNALPSAPPPFTTRRAGNEWTIPVSIGIMQLAGLASIGAGAIHAGVAGQHSENTTLTRLFIGVAVAQIAVGLLALAKGGRLSALAAAAVNLGAVAAWATTRLVGISWIDGLEESEAAQFTDTACAALGAVAAVAAVVALIGRRTAVSTVRLGLPAFSVGVVALSAMLVGADHSHGDAAHSHGDETAATADGTADAQALAGADDHTHEDGAAATEHSHEGDASTATATDDPAAQALSGAGGPEVTATDWPRPYDPAQPLDFSGVEGVSREQELRAVALVQTTLEELPAFADASTIGELGYVTIGDSSTGYEHYINYSLINDDVMLDPTKPESLVYRVDGDQRTLVSAMFIASERPMDDPSLTEYAGPLMEWHVHDNLCWVTDGGLRVAGVTDAEGNCPEGTVQLGGKNPMTHVWIVPHECGPFAALEGHGAGQTASNAGSRADQCAHDHGTGTEHAHDGDTAAAVGSNGGEAAEVSAGQAAAGASPEPVPYDPELPIDLAGTPGVTPEQQAFAENLVASTVRDLPQWADPATAEEAGFRSIGDDATGYEHYVQWEWINDDVWLDPDAPESLVYRVEDDGTRTLASAMFMLPDSMTLEDVPDWGGALMQWHVHSDLCFDVSDPESPRVGGLTDAAGGCTAPLTKLGEAPMIHVWITPHQCGPFAALEGVGAGQVVEGEEHLCDHAHGSHG